MKASAFPFVCLPNAAIWQLSISSHAKCLFAALLSYRNRKTGMCNPNLSKLAERLGKSLSTIRRALDQLRRAGMIIVRRTLFGNRYEIATPDRWQATISVTECALTDEQCAAFTDERTQRSRVSAQEPDVLEPEERHGAAVACVTTPTAAAAAATATLCTTEEHLTHPTPAPVVNPPADPTIAEAAEKLCVELMTGHPEPGNLPGAIAEAEKILTKAPEDLEATVEAMRSSHAAWRRHWASGARRFIPMLLKWFHDGDWRNPPVERKEIKSETWIERRDREKREYDEKFYRDLAEEEEWDVIRQYGGEHAVEVWREKIKTEAA